MLAEKDIKKKGQGSFDNSMEKKRKIVEVKWFDNKVVRLASSYVGIEPTDAVKRYDSLTRQHVHVSRQNIVR